MSGIAIKITSLLIRTVSKPIANRIKAQAREHPGFRRICVGWAQYLHRVDMRLRLGLLNDPAKYERQAAREAADAARKKREAEIPTVKTEAQTKAADEAARKAAEREAKDPAAVEKEKKEEAKPKIKPLSEAKAIDMGANFIAESFLFAVAVGTLFWDQYRSRKKEANRRNDVADKLAELDERDRLKQAQIEDMEIQIRHLSGHAGWQWPWKKEDGEKEVAHEDGKITAAVRAEIAREKERKRAEEESASTSAVVPAEGSKAGISKTVAPGSVSKVPTSIAAGSAGESAPRSKTSRASEAATGDGKRTP